MERLKEAWKSNLKVNLKRNLQSIIETNNNHHQLIKACAKAFADTSLSKKTGYQFYFLEPLIEKSAEKKNNCIFDLVIYNESDQSAIFIECKSSVKDSCGNISQIKDAKRLVLENIEYFSKKLDLDLDPNKIEFVECVYFEDSCKIARSVASQESQSREKKDDIVSIDIKVWEYLPGTEEIHLCNGHQHHNQILTEMLSERYGGDDLSGQFDVPYYLNLHLFLTMINIVLGYCYLENLSDDRVDDKKRISRNQIFKALFENAYFGLNKTEIKENLTKIMERLIKFGVDCDLFEIIDSEYIRLKCQGLQLKVVIEHLTKKYYENWADCKSEERAKIQALQDITTKLTKAHPTLDDFF